jgi:hypothetical protein
MLAKFGTTTTEYQRLFERLDVGVPVPDDGYQYVMAQHEWMLFGTTRHSGAQPNQTAPRPAVVNTKWGIKTLASANGDYVPVQDHWQRWFYQFWDWASWYRLPIGEEIETYVNPRNPGTIYTRYTPGSKLALYAGMIMDAKSHTDSMSPESGGRDVVTNRNPEARRPWEWLCRPTTGALLRVLSRNGSVLKIQAIDLNGTPPDVSTLQLWQYYFGTQVHINGSVSRYPDVKNAFEVHDYPPAGTAMPLVAPGGYFYIDRLATVELQPGQIWKPYYP